MYEETLPLDSENGSKKPVPKRVEKEIETGFEPDANPRRRSKEVSQLIKEGKLISIQNLDLWEEVLHEANESEKLVVVDFTTPWDLQTPDRHNFESFLSQLASECTDSIFVKADIFNVTDLKSVAEKWGVPGVPSIMFFKCGIIVNQVVTGRNYKELLKPTVKRIASSDPNCLDSINCSRKSITWTFLEDLYNEDRWLDSAFRSTTKNEAYLFIADTYMVVDYSNLDKLVEGPNLINRHLKYLRHSLSCNGTLCAFSSHDPYEAYIFSPYLCVRINYFEERIIETKEHEDMFPCLEEMGFLIPDAAFESSKKDEAYMFAGDKYVRINYKQNAVLEGPNKITDEGSFHFLSNTVFESGIEAAFTTHTTFDDGGRGNLVEAYIFKEGNFAVIRFTPGSTNGGYIVGDEPKRFIPHWPALVNVLPFKNFSFEYSEDEVYDNDDVDDTDDDVDDTDDENVDTDAKCTDNPSLML